MKINEEKRVCLSDIGNIRIRLDSLKCVFVFSFMLGSGRSDPELPGVLLFHSFKVGLYGLEP